MSRNQALGCLGQGYGSLGVNNAVGLTLALALWAASALAAIALCMATGILTSLISTRATLIPQCSVVLSRITLGTNTQPTRTSTVMAQRKPQNMPCRLDRRKGRQHENLLNRKTESARALTSNVPCVRQIAQPYETLADQCGFSTAS